MLPDTSSIYSAGDLAAALAAGAGGAAAAAVNATASPSGRKSSAANTYSSTSSTPLPTHCDDLEDEEDAGATPQSKGLTVPAINVPAASKSGSSTSIASSVGSGGQQQKPQAKSKPISAVPPSAKKHSLTSSLTNMMASLDTSVRNSQVSLRFSTYHAIHLSHSSSSTEKFKPTVNFHPSTDE